MRIFHVDAFTDKPFAGNPAGVCLLDREQPEDWMQRIAAEMNLSETAFLALGSGSTGFRLRWFTPTTEVSLCGHATLASAHILWEEAAIEPDQQALFQTKSGSLTAARQGAWIELGFPSRKVEATASDPRLLKALGVEPGYVGKYVTDTGNLYLLELQTDQQVRELQPDFRALGGADSRATIVTSVSTSKDYDFVSRFFAPAVGIDEDPVTGSAHCYLAPFWAERLGKNKLIGFQASARTGIVRCRLSENKVILCGNAITICRGELLV
jgi:PhzF family phenazine biosynthesis protein